MTMWCPKCETVSMEMYERFLDYDDGESLIGEEHFFCPNCHNVYSTDVTYVIQKRGELEE